MSGIITFRARIGVTKDVPPRTYYNHLPLDGDLGVITKKISEDLPLNRIAISPPDLVSCSPLGLVPKPGGWRRIYNLSSPCPHLHKGISINNAILDEYSSLSYSIIDDVLPLVL